MKTIKIIDIFNKIVNGEEVPLRIKWDGDTWEFKEQLNDYCNETEEEKEYLFYTGFDNYADSKRFLNCEVEIIEDEKEIEKLFHCCMESNNPEINVCIDNINILSDRINELIDAVKELKNKED